MQGDPDAMSLRPIRNLRIVGWAAGVPHRAQCTRCERIFSLTDSNIVNIESARDNLENQFRSHFCEEKPPLRRIA